MRFRLSSPWPLQGGAALAPASAIIDTENGTDHFSLAAKGLTPPYDAQALDDETYQFMRQSYPEHRHLMGPRPPTNKEE
jgi:hypothetical protein